MATTATAQAYRALLASPDYASSEKLALHAINARYTSWDQYLSTTERDGVLEDAQSRADQLQAQLSASQSQLDSYLVQTRDAATAHLHSAQELSLLRHSLSDELSQLVLELESSTSDERGKSTLLEEIEGMHRGLKELSTVRDYVQVITHALTLSEAAVNHLQTSQTNLSPSHAAITEYRTLDNFVSSVSAACMDVEDGSGPGQSQQLHLVNFLEGVRDKTWTDMKGALASTLIAAAEKLKWPMPVDYADCAPEDRREFENAFDALLGLQDLGSKISSVKSVETDASKPEKAGLYPLQALVTPVALRFKYHFDGSRQTNRMDKPEWYFTHILNVAHEHRSFFDTVVQRMLQKTSHNTISAWREFTSLLLPLLSRKIRKTVPLILHLPALLAHTTYQALQFDAALREQGFDLAGTSAGLVSSNKSWPGMSEVILSREPWFVAWLEGERTFAEEQYNDIIGAPDAWLVADDSSGLDEDADRSDGELRPTNSARRLKLLIEQVTDRYAPLPAASHRIRFFVGAQVPLLDAYHGRMASSLDAFETLSSSFVRAVPGALGVTASGAGSGAEQGVVWGGGNGRRLTTGVEGLTRLVKAWLSARYITSGMKGWGDDLFFLELWTEINKSPELRVRAERETLLPPLTAHPRETPDGTIFDVLEGQYEELIQRAEGMMVQHIYLEVESGLRAHLGGTTMSPQNDLQISTTLLGPIALLSSHIAYLNSTLPVAAVAAIYRTVASRLATHLLQRQVLYRGRGRISLDDGKRLAAEAELWLQTSRSALSRTPAARVEAPWRRYLQAARILGAEDGVWRKIVLVTLGAHDDQKWAEAMMESVGVGELSREEVTTVIGARADGGNVLP